MEARDAASGARSRDAIEASIYNHLYSFFNRYYEEGDFISKRRYSRNQRYAIPYNGEEVYLHWANSDQYYVKTDENFKNYDWKAPNGVDRALQSLEVADVEQNNVKGDKTLLPAPRLRKLEMGPRRPRPVTIPFDYRPLTTSGEDEHTAGQKQQDNIITAALNDIPEYLGDAPDALFALTRERGLNAKRPTRHSTWNTICTSTLARTTPTSSFTRTCPASSPANWTST